MHVWFVAQVTIPYWQELSSVQSIIQEMLLVQLKVGPMIEAVVELNGWVCDAGSVVNGDEVVSFV